MEKPCSSEMLITYYITTHCHSPDNDDLNLHCCENITSLMLFTFEGFYE